MEYVITPAVVVVSIGAYMQAIMRRCSSRPAQPFWNTPFWWAVFYVVFVGMNIIGIEATMRFTVVICVLALASSRSSSSLRRPGKFGVDLLDQHPRRRRRHVAEGGGPFLPFGIGGVFKAIPFAIWFYLAIEELPLAAEESQDPKRDIPKATIWGMHDPGHHRRPDPAAQHGRQRSERDGGDAGAAVPRLHDDLPGLRRRRVALV